MAKAKKRKKIVLKGDQIAEFLVKLGTAGELFHDSSSTAYVTYEEASHFETCPVESSTFRRWLQMQYFDSTGKTPTKTQFEAAVTILVAKAIFQGSELSVHLRVVRLDDIIYVDLGDPEWKCVRIDASGWTVVPHGNIKFRRPGGILTLPEPESGGKMADLRPLLPAISDDDWVLVQGFLVDCYRPDGSHPVLVLNGEQGSGKSVMCDTLIGLIDPHVGIRGSLPSEERNLAVAAISTYVLCFDNVSTISLKMSDSLCRLSSLSGFGIRKLYTDTDQIVIAVSRPVILNGIGNLSSRPDLDDRSIRIDVPVIDESNRRTERELKSNFETAKPKILGALFNAVSVGLKREGSVRPSKLPRNADTALWVTACEVGLDATPGAFLAAYKANKAQRQREAVENNPLASALLAIAMKEHRQGNPALELTATEILERLKTEMGDDDAPESAEKLSNQLARIAPILRSMNVDIVKGDRTSGRRPWIISVVTEQEEPADAA